MIETLDAVVVPVTGETHEPATTASPATDGAATAPIAPEPTVSQTAREFRESLRKQQPATQPAAGEPTAETVAAGATAEAPPEPVVDAAGRAHDPATGQFLPAAETATPEAASAPDGLVRIELPEGHPLRERGRTHYEVRISSPEEEAEIRGLLATPIKQRELKEAHARVAEMEEKLLRAQAEAEVFNQSRSDPDLAEDWAIHDAVAEVNPRAAALLKLAIDAKSRDKAEGRFTELATERLQQEVQQEAAAFRGRVQQVAETVYADIAHAPYFPELLQRAATAYGAEITAREARGEYGTHSEREFLLYLRPFVAAHPDASAVIRGRMDERQQAERERIAAEAKAQAEADAKQREEERLQAALVNRRTNPLGGLAVGLSTGRDTSPPDGPRNAKEFRASLRKVPVR